MGLETIALISFGAQAVGGLMQYSEQRKAEKAEKRAYNESVRIAQEQAELDRQDAEAAAKRETDEAEKHRSLQKMLFLKSGVDLTGSPLLVMEETRQKGIENAKNIRNSQSSRANLAIRSAEVNKPIKRSSLIGTVAGIAGSGAQSYYDYQIAKKQIG